MALKYIVLVTVLVAILAASQSKAQLLGVLGGLINISGSVFCSTTGNVVVNATTPPFSNAPVQVSCGGNVIASAMTNDSGIFSIFLNPLQFLLTSILSSCNLVVPLPLSSCNASLPSTGFLQSPLQLLGTTVRGLLSIVNLVPTGFTMI